MKTTVTENGLHIEPENQAEVWALRAIFPADVPMEKWPAKLVTQFRLSEEEDES